MEIKETIKLIAIYARVSTARQEEEGTIETQLSAVREFAKKNGYTIVQEYIDDGWSGDILVRPQLDQLRQDAKKKIWQAVLIYDPGRLARRYSYQQLLIDELRDAGIEPLFVTTPPPKNAEEKILQGVHGIFAEYERAKITERFRLGKLRKVKEGHVSVSEAPFGYTYIPKRDGKHGYYEVNQEEAKIVKKIFAWIATDGLTIRGVVRKLQELGIKPRKSKRGVWSTSTLSTLLRNTTYIGEAHYGRSYAVIPENPFKVEKYRKMRKTSRKMKPEEEWITIPVSAIIEKDLFIRAQQQLKENFELSNRNRKNEYLLAGRVWCSCGDRRAGEGPQRGKHLYYRCTNRVHSFPLPPKCLERGINARVADKLVWLQLAKLMSSPELLLQQLKRWIGQKQSKQQNSTADLDGIRKEIFKLKTEGDRYNKAYGAGLISIEKLKEYATETRERISLLEGQVEKAKTEKEQINGAALPKAHEIRSFAKRAVKTLHDLNFEAKQAIVRNIIDKVVGTKEQLQVYGYIPVENTNYVGYKTIHRHRGVTERRQVHLV